MLYRLIRGVLRIYFQVFGRWVVKGEENIPAEGGFIVVSNHVSNWDPPILATLMPKQVFFMAKDEFFHMPLIGPLFRHLGAFPVKRGKPDRGALRHALDLLVAERVLGIFPEGTRNITGKLLEPQPGVALLAIKSGKPVLPVGIKRGRGGRFVVNVGNPLVAGGENNKKEELHELARQIMAAVGRLLEE